MKVSTNKENLLANKKGEHEYERCLQLLIDSCRSIVYANHYMFTNDEQIGSKYTTKYVLAQYSQSMNYENYLIKIGDIPCLLIYEHQTMYKHLK